MDYNGRNAAVDENAGAAGIMAAPENQHKPAMPQSTLDQLAVPADVALWRLGIGDEALDMSGLSADEQVRCLRFLRPRDRIRFALTRSTLRRLLAGHLDCSPLDLAFILGPYGKPELQGGAPCFNVSHSHEYALIAIAGEAVGVDIERSDPSRDWPGIAAEILDEREQALCARDPAMFYQLWSAKEAVLKAWGWGLGYSAPSLAPQGGGFAVGLLGKPEAGTRVWNIDAGPGYAAALALGACSLAHPV